MHRYFRLTCLLHCTCEYLSPPEGETPTTKKGGAKNPDDPAAAEEDDNNKLGAASGATPAKKKKKSSAPSSAGATAPTSPTSPLKSPTSEAAGAAADGEDGGEDGLSISPSGFSQFHLSLKGVDCIWTDDRRKMAFCLVASSVSLLLTYILIITIPTARPSQPLMPKVHAEDTAPRL